MNDNITENVIETPLTRKELRKQKKLEKQNIVKYTLDNDIKYKGPLGIQHIKLLAWFFIILTQYFVLSNSLYPKLAIGSNPDGLIMQVLSWLVDLATPCFLLAAFSIIIARREECKELIITYAAFASVIVVFFFLLIYRYGAGLFGMFLEEGGPVGANIFGTFLATINIKLINFNIFIDLLLFTLLLYFTLCDPPNFFAGSREKYFRMLAILPVAYELTFFIIELIFALNDEVLPAFLYSIMPTKPILTFFTFLTIIEFEFKQKRKYLKQGGTIEGYNEYIKTRKHSWEYSKRIAKSFLFFGIVDFIIIVALYIMAEVDVQIGMGSNIFTLFISTFKFGDTVCLALLAPIVLLFSFNKEFKNRTLFNILLPLASIVAILLLYVEFIFQAITVFLA